MKCVNQKLIWPHVPIDQEDERKPYLVPCGKCVACLINKRTDWTLRLQQEHKFSHSGHFVTLTYDEKHLRTNRSLCKRDLQLYLKRLRRKNEQTRIRYYAVGEYGSRSGRPHYHILLFNSVEGDIRSSWTDSKNKPIGIVHVGKITLASIAYCTKYVIQKDQYPEGLEKPFATMSRAYGIGGRYLSDEMVSWHRVNEANYTPLPDNGKSRLPRFYRDKIWYTDTDRARIHSASLCLVLENEIKEKNYYALKYGSRGPAVALEARDLMLARVKQKIQFSQTF